MMRRRAVVSGLALAAGLTVSVAAQSGQPKAAAGAPETDRFRRRIGNGVPEDDSG